MPSKLIRFTRGGNVLFEGHVPSDSKVKEIKGDDGSVTYDLQFETDDMPGPNTANSELEARIPVVHAHAPGDEVNPEPEIVHVKKVRRTTADVDVVAGEPETAEAFQAPAEAQKELLKEEGRDPDASDKANAARRRKAAARRKASTTRTRKSTANA